MPKIPKNIEKICYHCRQYTIHTPGGAYCDHWKTYFPNPAGWYLPKYHARYAKKPGDRTCNKWRSKQ